MSTNFLVIFHSEQEVKQCLSKRKVCVVSWFFLSGFNVTGCILNFQLECKIPYILFYWHNKIHKQKQRVSTDSMNYLIWTRLYSRVWNKRRDIFINFWASRGYFLIKVGYVNYFFDFLIWLCIKIWNSKGGYIYSRHYAYFGL